jgi:hypothetical protein
MHTGTFGSKVIKKATGDEYTHSCISLDSSLNPLYQFGDKDPKPGEKSSAFNIGFSIINPIHNFFKTHKTHYGIYAIFMNKIEFGNIVKRLQFFLDKMDKLKYDFLALPAVFFHLPTEHSKKFFCSKFVADLLNAGRDFGKKASLYRPQNLAEIKDVVLVNKGEDFYQYDEKVTLKNIRKYKQGKLDEAVMAIGNISPIVTNGQFSDFNPEPTPTLRSELEEDIEDSDFMFGNGEYSALSDRNTPYNFRTEDATELDNGMFSRPDSASVKDQFSLSSNFEENNEEVISDMMSDGADNSADDSTSNIVSNLANSILKSNFSIQN